MVVPLLLGLGWEEVHLDVRKCAVRVLAKGTVPVEGSARLWSDDEGGECHEADASFGVDGVVTLDVAHLCLGVALLFALPLAFGDMGVAPVFALGFWWRDPGAGVHCLGNLPESGFLFHGRDLVEGTLLCACHVEGCFNDALAAFGCSAQAAAEGSDDVGAVAVEVGVDVMNGTLLQGAHVPLFDDGGKLEGNLFDYVEDGPGEVEAAVTQAGSFEPAADVGFCQSIGELFDTLDEELMFPTLLLMPPSLMDPGFMW